MRKLMIAAAIVCAAVVSQAAQFSWGFASPNIEDPAGGYIEGGTASLYIVDYAKCQSAANTGRHKTTAA